MNEVAYNSTNKVIHNSICNHKTYWVLPDYLFHYPNCVMYLPEYLGWVEIMTEYISNDEWLPNNKYYPRIVYTPHWLQSCRYKVEIQRGFDTEEQAVYFTENFLQTHYSEV